MSCYLVDNYTEDYQRVDVIEGKNCFIVKCYIPFDELKHLPIPWFFDKKEKHFIFGSAGNNLEMLTDFLKDKDFDVYYKGEQK